VQLTSSSFGHLARIPGEFAFCVDPARLTKLVTAEPSNADDADSAQRGDDDVEVFHVVLVCMQKFLF
jgi:hypothetical protein